VLEGDGAAMQDLLAADEQEGWGTHLAMLAQGGGIWRRAYPLSMTRAATSSVRGTAGQHLFSIEGTGKALGGAMAG
jgi:hypothetical protein